TLIASKACAPGNLCTRMVLRSLVSCLNPLWHNAFGRKKLGTIRAPQVVPISSFFSRIHQQGELMATGADVLKTIKDNEVKFVDLRFTDTRGKEQHVSVPVSSFGDSKF